MKKVLVSLWMIFFVLAVPAFGQERDPFTPYQWEAPSNSASTLHFDSPEDIKNPLVEKPLSSYRAVGLIVSPTDAIAVIKSRDKREYFANIGDPLGMEGGVIEIIDSEGITVDISGRVVNLPISNRFELQDDEDNSQ